MPEEQTNKRGSGYITKTVLQVIGAAGFLSVAAVAPNALQALDKMFDITGRARSNKKYYIKTVVTRLAEQGLIEFERRDGMKLARLTKKGEQRLGLYKLGELSITQNEWDGKWRVIIFDIQEEARWIRDSLRKELRNLDFRKLQRSVWITPYPCREVVTLLKADLHVGSDVLAMVVEELENDKWLREEFGLAEGQSG